MRIGLNGVMDKERILAGKTALITGASRGIGKAIAERFAQAGADLVLVARDKKKLAVTADLCQKFGAKVLVEAADIGDVVQIDGIFEAMKKGKTGLDILVNNAALMIKGLLQGYRKSDLDRMLAVNVVAPLILSQRAVALMKKRGGGAIVNISSLSGCFGVQKFPGFGVYDMSKYALWGLTEMLAIENMEHNIRVNQISLSAVDTDMYRSVAPEHLKASLAIEDVAKHVLYLAGPESAPLTGENVILTGMKPGR